MGGGNDHNQECVNHNISTIPYPDAISLKGYIMLTNTSNINILAGYQTHVDVSQITHSSNSENSSSLNRRETDDKVNISRKARELQQLYDGKKERLEQDYNSDAQQLEKEYLQEKNRLEREFVQKKKSLEINIYA